VPAGHVPDGEIEVFLPLVKVDLLVDRNECLGMETQVVFVYGEGELVCEACFSGSCVIDANTATPISTSGLA
jgi:hypothetical protein